MALGKAESPVVERTFYRKQCVRGVQSSLTWAGLNAVLAAVMVWELLCGPFFQVLSVIQPVLWYIECGLALVFTANVLWDVLLYFGWLFSTPVVEINPLQRKLMGIKENETGFRDPIHKTNHGKSPRPRGPDYSPSGFTSSRGSFLGMSNPLTPPHLTASPFSQSFCPYNNYTMISPLGPTPSPPHKSLGHRTPSPSPAASSPGPGMSPGGGSYLGSSSFLGTGALFEGSPGGFGSSLNASRSFSGACQGSPMSPLFKEAGPDTSGLRARFNNSSVRASPMRSDEVISDHKALAQFLTDQQDKEFRRQASSLESSPSASPSFWNYNRSLTDYTPVLKKYQYQVACRSPQQTKAKDADSGEPSTFLADEVWSPYNVAVDMVDKWIENLRKWLSDTILKSLVIEIDKVNDTLARIGCEDMQIGEVGIATLKQLATTKSQHVPTLNNLLPFLEVCANQEYLVSRIRELGGTGCMSEYKWNGGGSHKGKPWGEHLPTDAAILSHLLCSYLDSRLPPHPKYPDGRTFTSQHFLKTPDKPDATKKDHQLLYQVKVNPPHFKVMLDEDVLNPPKGRNNLFHSILLFLEHIKVKNHGMLGRINLGLSGINILWVLES